MPLGFHILTMGAQRHRGPRIASFMSIIRGNQDVIAMFVLGGVFERNPDLKIVCTEADAGWIPHFMYRMDHAVDREGGVMKLPQDVEDALASSASTTCGSRSRTTGWRSRCAASTTRPCTAC